MMVKILTLTGCELEMNIDPNDTIRSIKDKLEEQEGIPVDQQRLIYQGKKIRDDLTVHGCNIQPGTTLHLVIALRGGLTYAEIETKQRFHKKWLDSEVKKRYLQE